MLICSCYIITFFFIVFIFLNNCNFVILISYAVTFVTLLIFYHIHWIIINHLKKIAKILFKNNLSDLKTISDYIVRHYCIVYCTVLYQQQLILQCRSGRHVLSKESISIYCFLKDNTKQNRTFVCINNRCAINFLFHLDMFDQLICFQFSIFRNHLVFRKIRIVQ